MAAAYFGVKDYTRYFLDSIQERKNNVCTRPNSLTPRVALRSPYSFCYRVYSLDRRFGSPPGWSFRRRCGWKTVLVVDFR